MRQILGAVMVSIVLALATSAALAEGPTVYGTVTMKFSSGNGEFSFIAVDGTPYSVPRAFYATVLAGSKVQFDGLNWSILK